MRFVEAFLIYCLLEESPYLDDNGLAELNRNHVGVAKNGRDPDFRLFRDGQSVTLRSWAHEILTKVSAVAEVIDRHEAGGSYADSVRLMQETVDNVKQSPSARLLADLEETRSSFFEFGVDLARRHSDYFQAITALDEDRRSVLEQEATDSLRRQREIEVTDDIPLDDYLQRYFSNF
jgi:glutamate--cysteine ligase